jgi:hypothetical protein
VRIPPQPEGSLDEASPLAPIEVVARHTAPDALRDSGAYFGPVTFFGDNTTVYAGDLRDLPALVNGQQRRPPFRRTTSPPCWAKPSRR